MHDSDEDLRILDACPPLRDAVLAIDPLIVQPFDAFDARAVRQQDYYRWIVRITAVGGGLAVLSALAQLTLQQLGLPDARDAFGWVELGALFLSLVAVISGRFLAWLESWLLDRFKAEQLRLLKFRALLDPRLWTAASCDAWRADVVSGRDRIVALTRRELRHEAESDVLPRLPMRTDCAALAPADVEALLDYYGRKRIDGQLRYFQRAAARGQPWIDNPKLLKWFFSASVLIVAMHAIAEAVLRRRHLPGSETLAVAAVILVALSAALPILWASIRTYRSAREFSRNVARSEARRKMLEEVGRRVDAATGVDAEHVLCQLQMCELVLETDQREWLRLMREVEWYG